MAQSPTVRTLWTPADEAKLQELQGRRASVMNDARNAVKLAVDSLPVENPQSFDLVVDYLIKNADKLTAALKPFTSDS